MPPESDDLLRLEQLVLASGKYACITPELVRSIGLKELAKRSNIKEAVKSTRNKLHQVASSYREKPIPFNLLERELLDLPSDLAIPGVRSFLQSTMSLHISTAERLPILDRIFGETLRELPPITSVLDLACGLNPLAIPWMPLEKTVQYYACDVFTDMLSFLNQFFSHFALKGSAFACDLTTAIPQHEVDLAIALKTIPCLEQVDKQVGIRLLEQVKARYLLISFPAHSLAGKSKGMVRNYEAHFLNLVAGKTWELTRYEFPGELVFLVRK
jgi:16S rRNA (guanine(1405)-N(7))-methyltransferase